MRNRILCTLLALTPAACAADDLDDVSDDNDGAGGKADDVDPADFACQNVGGVTPDELAEINDPIAALLLKPGESCPTNYGDMLAKLREIDGEGCEEGRDIRTRVVSDDARLADNPSNYRTVSTRACGSHDEDALIWTLLSVREDEDMAARGFVEIMAFDPVAKEHNFWVLSGGWEREGNTQDIIDGGAGCQSCHPSGGIIMKELDEPWVHWESEDMTMPGVDELFAAHGPLMGIRGNGRDLEDVVRAGNEHNIEGRITRHSNPELGNVEQLLRPLFCSLEMNIDTAGEIAGERIQEVPADFFIDPHFGVDRGVLMPAETYEAVLGEFDQTVPGIVPQARDTAFPMAFPERSGIDVRYVEQLVAKGVIDSDLATDVLAIDFTRPLISPTRCALLDFAPVYGEPEPDAEPEPEPDGESDSDGEPDPGDPTGEPEPEEPVDPGTCCDATANACDNEDIKACVCASDDFCCNSWDSLCTEEVESFGCFDCNGDGEVGDGGGGGGDTPAPKDSVTIQEATPDAIREGFIANLQKAEPEEGTPAAQLLAALLDREDEASHRARVDGYLAACAERDPAALARDTVRRAELLRGEMRSFGGIIEHQEQLPRTTLSIDEGFVLDPQTCSSQAEPDEPVEDPEDPGEDPEDPAEDPGEE